MLMGRSEFTRPAHRNSRTWYMRSGRELRLRNYHEHIAHISIGEIPTLLVGGIFAVGVIGLAHLELFAPGGAGLSSRLVRFLSWASFRVPHAAMGRIKTLLRVAACLPDAILNRAIAATLGLSISIAHEMLMT